MIATYAKLHLLEEFGFTRRPPDMGLDGAGHQDAGFDASASEGNPAAMTRIDRSQLTTKVGRRHSFTDPVTHMVSKLFKKMNVTEQLGRVVSAMKKILSTDADIFHFEFFGGVSTYHRVTVSEIVAIYPKA